MNRRWGLAALLVVLTVIVYLPVRHAGFLWDDDTLLTDSSLIHSTSGLWRMWIPVKSVDYYPVTWTTFWLEWRLWGLDATGYHVTNVLLQILGALLIWQILEQLKIRGAWLAALLFAIHPVNVESVAWIAERKNTLSLVFYALTVLAFLHFERTADRRWYRAALGVFLLALLSKTSGLMLPVVLLLCAWWQRGAVHRRDLLRCAPFLLLAAVFAGLTVWTQSWSLATGPTTPIHRSLFFRLGAAGHVFWFYLFKILLPVRLMTIYPLWKFYKPNILFWLPTLTVLVALAVAWRLSRGVLFGLLYFGVMLLPVLGILNAPYIGRSPVVTDHLQYLAMIGIVALVAAGVTRLPDKLQKTTGVVLVGALGFLSWNRVLVHQDQETLWTDTLAKNPTAAKAHFMLGVVYDKRHEFDAAIAQYQESLRLNPHNATLENNLANIYAKLDERSAAFPHYAAALRLRPNFPDAECNWANALAQDGRSAEAMTHYTLALRLNPGDAQAHNNLGVELGKQHRYAEAATQFAAAARLEPDNADYRRNLELARAASQ